MLRANNLQKRDDLVVSKRFRNSTYHIFRTQLMTKLIKGGVEDACRWIKNTRVQLFDKKLLLFPIVENYHYSLMVVANPGHVMKVHDPDAGARSNTHWPG